MIGRESNRDRDIKQNLRQIWAVFEGKLKKQYINILKNSHFPEDLQKRRIIFKQEKAVVSDCRHNCPQTPTGRAVRAGAVRGVLVLFWCCKHDKCDEKAIKVVFLVVSEKIKNLENAIQNRNFANKISRIFVAFGDSFLKIGVIVCNQKNEIRRDS